jgi:hypothetical protein
MPRTALRKGSKMDNVDCAWSYISNRFEMFIGSDIELTFSAFPLAPTNVPLLVYSFCEADNETDKREYGAPSTSNRASINRQCISRLRRTRTENFPYLQDPSKHQLSSPKHLR